LLELIEALVPEPLVLVHPSSNLPKWLPPKGNENFTPLLAALDESCSITHTIEREPSNFIAAVSAAWRRR